MICCLFLQVQQREASLLGDREVLSCKFFYMLLKLFIHSFHQIPQLTVFTPPVTRLSRVQEMTRGNRYKTISWRFIESLEPPKVVHARCPDMVSKGNLYGQVTVRMHSKQVRVHSRNCSQLSSVII